MRLSSPHPGPVKRGVKYKAGAEGVCVCEVSGLYSPLSKHARYILAFLPLSEDGPHLRGQNSFVTCALSLLFVFVIPVPLGWHLILIPKNC